MIRLVEILKDMERKKLKKELDKLKKSVKSSSFVDPSDMVRIKEIESLLISNGDGDNIKLKVGKFKNPKRTTNFHPKRW